MKDVLVQTAMVVLLIVALPCIGQERVVNEDSVLLAEIRANANTMLNGTWFNEATGYRKMDSTSIDTILIDRKKEVIRVYADNQLAYFPARIPVIDSIERGLVAGTDPVWEEFSVAVYSGKKNIREYVPNYFRLEPKSKDISRTVSKKRKQPAPLVRNLSRSYLDEASLSQSHIALWHSHGWYYEPALHRWEWQRARLFQTVEDIYPMTYTLQFLVPMLENAGANVLMPRERDWQTNEVIVDNDGSTGNSLYISALPGGNDSAGTGFGLGQPPYTDQNPFRLGTFQEMVADKNASGSMQWIPDIPESGEYAVYVSYGASENNVDDARYVVHHAGGETEFLVNQMMGAGTWIFLGKFRFKGGLDPRLGRVVLTNESGKRKSRVSGDAVRFGGGMGIISRNGMTGLRPRYMEAARYYLQFAGFDTLVWNLNGPEADYKDDYQSRGEWVSYLMGTETTGLGIPVDLSFAFHTDAGITDSDTVIGTLGIFSTNYRKRPFPSGLSRMASRDLADLVQSQIVDDIRMLYDPAWTRRGLWDKPYSEAFRPNAPSMLLELFSHQNFIDMRFGQEPMFRFHASRAIYKGMLKFMSELNGTVYVVQPLPVTHMAARIGQDSTITVSWKPQPDPLESTARPDRYRVYTRMNEGGFDQGVEVEDTLWTFTDLHMDSVYSFKVTALNGGGESFPSEVLSVCYKSDSKGKILVVSAFDRTGGPAFFDDTEHAGFLPVLDQGVPYHVDLHTVGAQYDYKKSSPWLDDDSPGHGASFGDLEGTVIPGNSFDFTYPHGVSIAKAGYSFESVSDESITDDSIHMAVYDAIDFIAGEEKTSYFPKNDSLPLYQVLTNDMIQILARYLEGGGNLFISGAHIASDIHDNGQDSLVARFLKYKWRTSNASKLGGFYFTDPSVDAYTKTYEFNTGIHSEIYTVEGADALEPSDSTSVTFLRYRENNMSAAVAFRGEYGVVAMGFPFETILSVETRNAIMGKVLNYLIEPIAHE